MKISFRASLLIGIAFSFLLSSCKDDTPDPADKFQIGVLLPITGAASSSGESSGAALNIALGDVRDYLQTTGNNLDVELVIKDTKTNGDTALQKLKELKDAGIKYVIGPYTSANAEAVLPYANQQGIFLLSPSSVATTLAIPNDNLYRSLPSDRSQAEAIAALFKHDSIEVVIPVVRNDVWGSGLLSDATQILTVNGLDIQSSIVYDPASFNSLDIAGQIANAITALQGQVPLSGIAVYLMSFAEGTEILSASAMISANSLVNWYGSSAFSNNSSILQNENASEFAFAQNFRAPSFAPDPAFTDLLEPVNQALMHELGRSPEVFAFTSYDAVFLMVLTYVMTNEADNLARFKTSFEQTTGYYSGLTGRATLDENGDRKFASFNFWGMDLSGGQPEWKSYGLYNNSNGQLVIY